jgi:hypothetical protein
MGGECIMELAFRKFDKIARLKRDIIITEKIDGTNAQVLIDWFANYGDEEGDFIANHNGKVLWHDDDMFMMAGSRKRYLSLEQDNFGFARWVSENAQELLSLGAGRHYGEWWGKGIQRRYGMDKKVFSLFNVHRWDSENIPGDILRTVPVMYRGEFSAERIDQALDVLRLGGSLAAPGFMDPEGVVIYMVQARTLFKVTIKDDGIPKSLLKE